MVSNLSIVSSFDCLGRNTADHKAKEETGENKMFLIFYYSGRTYRTSHWSFKAAQHLRKKSSHVAITYFRIGRLPKKKYQNLVYLHSAQL